MPYLACTYASLWVTNNTAFRINTMTVGVVNATFSFPTIILNLLVISAFARKKKLRKGSNMILFSLSMTDLLSGLFIQPFMAIISFNTLVYSPDDFPCWLVETSGFVGYILASVSLVTVSFISIERYIAIFHPFIYSRRIDATVIKRTCVFLWVIPATVIIGLFFSKGHDAFYWVNGIFIAFVYIWNIGIYARISRQVYKVRRELLRLHTRFSNQKSIASQSKVTQVAGSIIIALLVCYLPQVIGSLLRLITRHQILLEYVEYWTATMALLSPGLNPIFYCYYNTEIRKEVFFMLKYTTQETRSTHLPGAGVIRKPAIVKSNLNPQNFDGIVPPASNATPEEERDRQTIPLHTSSEDDNIVKIVGGDSKNIVDNHKETIERNNVVVVISNPNIDEIDYNGYEYNETDNVIKDRHKPGANENPCNIFTQNKTKNDINNNQAAIIVNEYVEIRDGHKFVEHLDDLSIERNRDESILDINNSTNVDNDNTSKINNYWND